MDLCFITIFSFVLLTASSASRCRAVCASATRPHVACARANHVWPNGANNVICAAASADKPAPINWVA